MIVKKSGGKVFGAVFTADEKKALDVEIQKEMLAIHDKYWRELDATVLWLLHSQLGFGLERMHKFYLDFARELREIRDRYDMHGEDLLWVTTQKLKDYGADLEAWEKEI